MQNKSQNLRDRLRQTKLDTLDSIKTETKRLGELFMKNHEGDEDATLDEEGFIQLPHSIFYMGIDDQQSQVICTVKIDGTAVQIDDGINVEEMSIDELGTDLLIEILEEMELMTIPEQVDIF